MTDWYFAPRYYIIPQDLGTIQGAEVEFGKVWGQGMFLGVDLGYGNNGKEYYNFIKRYGIGVNFGNAYHLPAELQLVYGVSAGYWRDLHAHSVEIGGPSLKLRWRFLELSYRGLTGWHNVGDGVGEYLPVNVDKGYKYDYETDEYRYDEYRHDAKGTNVYFRNQLTLGLYFATSKRAGLNR
jgi:hypothetical protein